MKENVATSFYDTVYNEKCFLDVFKNVYSDLNGRILNVERALVNHIVKIKIDDNNPFNSILVIKKKLLCIIPLGECSFKMSEDTYTNYSNSKFYEKEFHIKVRRLLLVLARYNIDYPYSFLTKKLNKLFTENINGVRYIKLSALFKLASSEKASYYLKRIIQLDMYSGVYFEDLVNKMAIEMGIDLK